MALPDAGDIARMRRIIARLRSYGVEVREMPGWERRGFRFPSVPTRVFDHHDASSRKSGEWGALGLILDGTPRGIPGPLSNFQVARCLDGKPRVAVVAAGYSYHAGAGGPYAELGRNNANPVTYGTEKANDGIGEPYTAAANYATNALFHAAAVESGAAPESFPIGHKEWAPGRKSDPLYSMADRRRQVGAFTPAGTPGTPAPPPKGDFDMQRPLRTPDGSVWNWTGFTIDHITDPIESGVLQKAVGGLVDVDWAEKDAITRRVEHNAKKLALTGWAYVGSDGGVDAYQRLNDVLATANSIEDLVTTGVSGSPVDADTLAAALARPEVAAIFGDALAAAQDRRARDGDPTTGPVS